MLVGLSYVTLILLARLVVAPATMNIFTIIRHSKANGQPPSSSQLNNKIDPPQWSSPLHRSQPTDSLDILTKSTQC